MRTLILLSALTIPANADDHNNQCTPGAAEVITTFSNDDAPEEMEMFDAHTALSTLNAAFFQAGREASAAVLIDIDTGAKTELPILGQNLGIEHAAVGAAVLEEGHSFVVNTTQGPTTGGPELVLFERDDFGGWTQSYFSSYPGNPYEDINNGAAALPSENWGEPADTVLFTDAVDSKIYITPPGGGSEATVWLDASGMFPPIIPGQQMGLNALEVVDDYVYVTYTGGLHPVDQFGNPLPPPFGDVNGGLYRVPIDNPSAANLELVIDLGLAMPDGVFEERGDIYVTLANPFPPNGSRVARIDNIDGCGGAVINTTYTYPELVMPANGYGHKGWIYVVGHNIFPGAPIPPSGNLSNMVRFCVDD